MKNNLSIAIQAAIEAGKAILEIYALDFEVEIYWNAAKRHPPRPRAVVSKTVTTATPLFMPAKVRAATATACPNMPRAAIS